jgi:RNAse (barnase) inhibitor barstar
MLVGDCELVLLNGIENEVGSYFVADVTLEKIERRTDSIGSVDLTLTLDCDTIHPEAEWSWILVCSGNLDRTGMWHRLSQQGRDAWLSVALNHHGYRKASSARLHAVYEMDGRYITDETSFFCSLGELINGPGGYFGWNLSALEDCLNGGWGAASPFQLKWHHSEESRFRIARDERLVREYEGRFLEYLDDIFARHRIEIVLL